MDFDPLLEDYNEVFSNLLPFQDGRYVSIFMAFIGSRFK